MPGSRYDDLQYPGEASLVEDFFTPAAVVVDWLVFGPEPEFAEVVLEGGLAFVMVPAPTAVEVGWMVVGDMAPARLDSPVGQSAYVDVVAAVVVTAIAPPISTQAV